MAYKAIWVDGKEISHYLYPAVADFEDPETGEIHDFVGNRPGITVVTGVAGASFLGNQPDWTSDDLTFLVGPKFLTNPGEAAPTYDTSNVLVVPATMETNASPNNAWVGWGVDSANSTLDVDGSGQVRITARVVSKSPICILVRVGFQLTVFWHGKFPGLPENIVSFQGAIRPLFRPIDVEEMKKSADEGGGGGLDLSSYQQVRNDAATIYDYVNRGAMPCAEVGGRWPPEWVALFGEWMNQNYPP